MLKLTATAWRELYYIGISERADSELKMICAQLHRHRGD
jgi:hypothetical protein